MLTPVTAAVTAIAITYVKIITVSRTIYKSLGQNIVPRSFKFCCAFGISGIAVKSGQDQDVIGNVCFFHTGSIRSQSYIVWYCAEAKGLRR